MAYGNWQRQAVAWFNSQTGGTHTAFADAAAEYYFKAASGEITAPVDPSIQAQLDDHEARITALETP